MSTTYSYTKTVWIDKEDPEYIEGVSPSIDQFNLGKVEDHLELDGDGLDDHEDRIGNLETKLDITRIELYNGSATLTGWTYVPSRGWYESATISNNYVDSTTDVFFTLANARKAEYGNLTLLLPEEGSSEISTHTFKAAVAHTGIPANLTLYYKVTRATEGQQPVVKIVPWATGTDEEIAAMVSAADEGIIDLHDYWSVGDTRTVHLSATSADASAGIEAHTEQDAEFVIMDSTCTGFTLTGTTQTPAFIVGLKDGLIEVGGMSKTNDTSGGWRDCMRRSWCNNQFKSSIPSALLPIFKQFTWQTGKGGGASSGLNTTNDYFALAPDKAIFTYRSPFSFYDESLLYTQWDWYKTADNRIKKNGATGVADFWYEASPVPNNSYDFSGVDSGGHQGKQPAYTSYGGLLLAPFGCI